MKLELLIAVHDNWSIFLCFGKGEQFGAYFSLRRTFSARSFQNEHYLVVVKLGNECVLGKIVWEKTTKNCHTAFGIFFSEYSSLSYKIGKTTMIWKDTSIWEVIFLLCFQVHNFLSKGSFVNIRSVGSEWDYQMGNWRNFWNQSISWQCCLLTIF